MTRYSGETRLQRLLLVARTTADEALAAQAFRMAEQQMKEDGNVKKYKEVFGSASRPGQSVAGEATQSAGENDIGGMFVCLFADADADAEEC